MLKRHHQRTDGGLRAARWLAPIAALSMLGCPNEDLAPLEPCTVSGVSNEVPVTGVDKVDLLFVIDNSTSMTQEQAKLAKELPNLVEILTTGKRNGETTPSFTPVRDLHLGVVTSDMGTNGRTYQDLAASGCDGYGDNGKLVSVSTAVGCSANAPSGYLTFIPNSPNPNENDLAKTISSFSCLANVGTKGCGFEQQLEAMYKAVAPSDVKFAGGQGGNGGIDGSNRGFLRSDAVLAIIQVSDEEDCSVSDKGLNLFEIRTTDPVISTGGQTLGFNIRCGFGNPNERETQVEKAGYIHPVSRYIEEFKAKVKPLNPDRIIFAAIVGIPDGTEEQSFDEILAHPRMGFAIDPITGADTSPGDPTHIQTSARDVCRRCFSAEGAACESLHPTKNIEDIETGAKPAVRFVKVAKGFGDNGLIRSICAPSYAPAVDTIIDKISKQLKGACLPRELNPNAEGVVECDVVEILEQGKTQADCQAARGRKFLETRDGRTVCSINQVPVQNKTLVDNPNPLEGVNPRTGWYYDTFSPKVTEECPDGMRRRISFSSADAEPVNAVVKFECFQPVVSSEDQAIGKAAVNLACDAAGISCEDRKDPTDGFSLVCEPSSKTCQIGCQQDTHCPVGWVCDAEGSKICINPTCLPPNLR